MPDNNPIMRATLARYASNFMSRTFTSTFEIAGLAVPAALTELDESDKLEIAGREIKRAQSGQVVAAAVKGAEIEEGLQVVLDGDPNWILDRWKLSPDGAMYTFLLIDGQ